MDCNQCKNPCTGRPKVQVPPCVNTNVIPGCCVTTSPLRPQTERPMNPNTGFPAFMTEMGGCCIDQMPLAMGYVPMQRWRQTYPLAQGFQRGTIFPELDLPFMMGRCHS